MPLRGVRTEHLPAVRRFHRGQRLSARSSQPSQADGDPYPPDKDTLSRAGHRASDPQLEGAEHSAVTLPRVFYERHTLDVARDLLGKVLVHDRRGVRTAGIIVEVEAYIGESDPACHAAPGPTRRNEPLYGPPGHVYVYLNYGIHCLVNVVTEPLGSPAAVLVRSLDPIEGTDVMRRRRARATKGRRTGPDVSALR